MKISKWRQCKQDGSGESIKLLQQPPRMMPRMEKNILIVDESWHPVLDMTILLFFVQIYQSFINIVTTAPKEVFSCT